jgi:hypothetical protein
VAQKPFFDIASRELPPKARQTREHTFKRALRALISAVKPLICALQREI